MVMFSFKLYYSVEIIRDAIIELHNAEFLTDEQYSMIRSSKNVDG